MFHKTIVGGIVLIFLLCSFIPISTSLESSSHNTIYINSKRVSNGSIQDAIDNANSGDTIYISSGIYYEHIVVDKPLTIIGNNPIETPINAVTPPATIIPIKSTNHHSG